MKGLKSKKILLVFFVIILLYFFISTYGRYIYNGIRNYYLSTKEFYFNSDKLSDNISSYQLDNWSGVEPVSIVFNMDSKKNNLVSSPSDINYDIIFSCSNNVTCNASKTTGVILNNNATDSFSIVMSPNVTLHNGDSIWLEVEARANSPYTKTLKGKFVIKVATIGLSYEIQDVRYRTYLDFNITNTFNSYTIIEAFGSYAVGDKIEISEYLALTPENKEKCASAIVKLTFDPNVLRLDMTSEFYLKNIGSTSQNVSGNNYVNSFTFKVDAISSSSVRFYKLDTNNDYTYPFISQNPIISFQVE